MRAIRFCQENGIRAVVSSEDKEILAHVASETDTVHCIKRPANLATDEVNSMAVLKHAAELMEIDDYWNLLLEPTSPWRYADDVQRCLDEAHSDRWVVATAEPVKTVNGASARFNGACWLLGPVNSWFSNEVTQVVFTDYRPNIDWEVDYHIAANLMSWHRGFHAKWLQEYKDSLHSQTPSSPQTTHTAPENSQ